jgi:MFS family permease
MIVLLRRLRGHLNNPLVLAFYVPSLLFAFAQGLLIPVLPLFAGDLTRSYGLIGVLLAGQSVGMLVGDVPAGMLTRRLGKKRAMLLGLACTALATAALFWARSIPEALLYRLVSGGGAAAFGVARHAYIADNTAAGVRGRAISLLGGIFRVGRFVAPAVGGTLATAMGLRAPFLLYCGASLLALAFIAVYVERDAGEKAPARAATGRPLAAMLATLRRHRRVLATAGMGQLFAQMIRTGRTIIVPLYAADVLGLDAQAIGLIISVAGGIDMTLFYPTGIIMDRWGRKYAIVPSFSIQTVGMALIPFSGSFAGLLLATGLMGFGNGLGSGTMMTLGADLKPPGSRGEFLGVWRLIGDMGGTVAPLLVGAVADVLLLPAAAGALALSGLSAALVFGLLVPETLRKPRPSRPSAEYEGAHTD